MYGKSGVGNLFHPGPYFGQTACRRALQEISVVQKLLTTSVICNGLTHLVPNAQELSQTVLQAGNKKKRRPHNYVWAY